MSAELRLPYHLPLNSISVAPNLHLSCTSLPSLIPPLLLIIPSLLPSHLHLNSVSPAPNFRLSYSLTCNWISFLLPSHLHFTSISPIPHIHFCCTSLPFLLLFHLYLASVSPAHHLHLSHRLAYTFIPLGLHLASHLTCTSSSSQMQLVSISAVCCQRSVLRPAFSQCLHFKAYTSNDTMRCKKSAAKTLRLHCSDLHTVSLFHLLNMFCHLCLLVLYP